MKKLIALGLTLVMCFSMVACGSSGSSGSDSKETEVAEVDYATVTADIDKAIEWIDKCANTQHDWLGVSNNLPYLYSDDNYAGGNNNDARKAGEKCYNSRKNANEKMESAKNALKGGSGDYHDAVQEYYLAAYAYLSFVSNFPEGYNKITWGQKWNELKQDCDSAAGKIELYE